MVFGERWFLPPPSTTRLCRNSCVGTIRLNSAPGRLVIRLMLTHDCPLIEAITPLIITFDEAPNIARTLNKLAWARRIVVVDSGSTDGTLDVLARYPQVALFKRPFDNFADQCNFGLDQIESEWVLSLDADYELSDRLVEELANLRETDGVAGYRAYFVYRIYGRPLRGTLYPPRMVLYRAKNAR